MKMKAKGIILIALMMLMFGSIQAATTRFANETLHYVISYKWGLIHKDAGDATLTLRNHGPNYELMLAARTKPWADRFYMVRDTLKATMRSSDMMPLRYSKITHEKGKYGRDDIRYFRYGTVTKGECESIRERNGRMETITRDLSATGPVYDMLSVFYYLRKLDYNRLQTKSQVYKATVFSGSKAETITIRSLGKQRIKMRNKQEREAYHIRFRFTQHNGKKSSDDIDTWISTDAAHVPLYLVGKLPMGEVRAYLM